MFEEAVHLAAKLEDIEARVQCLGIKVLAFQEIERLSDAFETAGEILQIAEEKSDLGMKCDALASQAQILVDSGEPNLAFDKVKEARRIADGLGDPRRSMNVLGVFGNLHLALSSGKEAKESFVDALELARRLGDRPAECGFLGNIGSILAWHGAHARAAEVFEQVLSMAEALGDGKAERNALLHLTKAHAALENHDKVLELAGRGIESSRDIDNGAASAFYQARIEACYRANRNEDAHIAAANAIELARETKDYHREIDLLLSLGESYLVSGMTIEALDVYQSALDGAKKLSRLKDEATLTGRIGVVLAELGRLDEATTYHERAVGFARERNLPELEGEQLSMLAFVCRDQGT